MLPSQGLVPPPENNYPGPECVVSFVLVLQFQRGRLKCKKFEAVPNCSKKQRNTTKTLAGKHVFKPARLSSN